jgi:hypothetical protein
MSSITGGPRAPAKRVPGPRYPLADYSKLFRLAFVSKTRAIREVVNRIGVGEPEAQAFVLKALMELTPGQYCHTVEMHFDAAVVADVYGLNDIHGDWYFKFYMDPHGRILVCSCHEPEHPMTRLDGVIVRPK